MGRNLLKRQLESKQEKNERLLLNLLINHT